MTLAKLDRVIQAVMGWTNSHLHEFEIEGQRYGMPLPEEDGLDDNPPLDERRARIGRRWRNLRGYAEFLEAIGDPTHEEHLAMWRWAGGPFDPLGFDVNAANFALRNLKL